MRLWAQHINQLKTWQRVFLLSVMLFLLWGMWYFLLEKPLLQKNQVNVNKQKQALETLKQINFLSQSKANYVYKNELQQVNLRQTFESALSTNTGVQIATFNNNPVVALPAGASQFGQLKEVLGISMLSAVHQAPSTIVFSAKFETFQAYLKTLQNNKSGIYFDSIDFNMNQYPKAKITMKVFTLGV